MEEKILQILSIVEWPVAIVSTLYVLRRGYVLGRLQKALRRKHGMTFIQAAVAAPKVPVKWLAITATAAWLWIIVG